MSARIGVLGNRPISRRSMLKATTGAGVAAAIAGMTFPRAMGTLAQTPEGEIPAKTLSGTAITTITGEPQSFNPDFQVDDMLWPIAGNLYNSLFMLDNDFNVIPDLATGYEISDDGMSITVAINPLATWHDGTPVTSADVKYTLEAIVGDAAAPASSLIGALASVDTPEEKTAVLNLSRASGSIIGFLSWYGVFILPAHIYAGTDWATNEANQAPIGSGPFKFGSYQTGSSVELLANENYFSEGPYLERLIFQIIPDPSTSVQALLNGEVDMTGLPNAQVETVEANPDYRVIGKVYPSPIYFGFNLAQTPLDNLEVRRAIGMAIDREQIVATALGGYGTSENRYYPHVIEWASNPDATAPAMDVAGANALLDEQGVAMSGDKRFDVQLLTFTGWQEAADTATVLKEQLAAIGLNVEITLLEFAAWEEKLIAGEFSFGMLGGFQGPDPANLSVRWGTDTGLNHWGYANPEFDQLLLDGDSATTQEGRIEAYFAAQSILAADIPGIPLVLQTFFDGVSNRLSGVWTDPDDPASSLVGMNRFTLTKIAS